MAFLRSSLRELAWTILRITEPSERPVGKRVIVNVEEVRNAIEEILLLSLDFGETRTFAEIEVSHLAALVCQDIVQYGETLEPCASGKSMFERGKIAIGHYED